MPYPQSDSPQTPGEGDNQRVTSADRPRADGSVKDSGARADDPVNLGRKFNNDADSELLKKVSPHPPGDQVDRSVVAGELLKAVSLWAVRLVIIGVFLYFLFGLLGSFWRGILPVVLSLIVCTVLAPIAGWLRRHKIPDALAAITCIFTFFGVIGGFIGSIAPDFARQSQSLYLQTVEGVQRLQLWAQGPPLELNSDDMSSYIDEAAGWLQTRAGTIAGSVFTGIGAATTLVITLFIMLVMTFFFLKDGHKFLPWLREATGRRTGWHLTELLTRAWLTLGGFIRAQAIVSAIDAVFIGVGLAIIGVPLAMALAIITFIAGFIPFVGAIVAGALSVVIALVSLGFTEAIIVLGLVLAVQQIEGNILSPWLQSKAMNLHPVVVLVSVTIGSALFNLVGAFLAVPAAAMLAVGYRYLQDMLRLQSGEARASDIEFFTVAGTLVGKYNEAQGTYRRQVWREMPADAESALLNPDDREATKATNASDLADDLFAAETKHDGRGFSVPRLDLIRRTNQTRDFIERLFSSGRG